MPAYLFTSATFIATFLCIPMTYFTFRSTGYPWATVLLIGWIFIENLLLCLDSIIWSGDSPEEWWEGQIYCDINSRIKSAFVIGVPGAGVGLCRFLADVTNPKIGSRQFQSTRWRRNVFDLTFGIILPLVNAGVKLLVNPARYHIWGIYGCVGLTDFTWLSIPLYWIWTPTLSFIAAVYACTPLFYFLCQCRHFPPTLVGSR
jgi:pheromone a factor receptor